jgi:hypothetical protein
MGTNLTFTPRELEKIHTTLLKVRSILFEAREIKFDTRSLPKPGSGIPVWKGERGSCPEVKDLDETIALTRLHINSEETIQYYDALGMFDQAKKEEPEGPSS